MYCDSCIIVKLLSAEADSSFFDRELQGHPLSTSELAVPEVFSALLAKERAGVLTAKERSVAWRQFERWIDDEEIELHPMDSRGLQRAKQQLERCHPEIPLRTLDALHIAACEESGDYPMATTDRRMRAAAAKLKIPIFPETHPNDKF